MSVETIDDLLSNMTSLHEKIARGEYSIEVKETAIGQLATLNKGGERTLSQSEHDELEELLEKYEDIIIELWDAYHQDDDPHMSKWRMGKVLKEEIEEDEQRDMEMLIPLLPFTDSQEYRQRYLIQMFYETFPDKDWEEKESPTTISDLAQRSGGPEEARQIYNERMRDVDVSFTRDEVRVWSDVRKSEDDTCLQFVAEKAADRFSPRSPSPKNIKNIHRLLGKDNFPPDEEIESAIREA
jgi:hypothetical protein